VPPPGTPVPDQPCGVSCTEVPTVGIPFTKRRTGVGVRGVVDGRWMPAALGVVARAVVVARVAVVVRVGAATAAPEGRVRTDAGAPDAGTPAGEYEVRSGVVCRHFPFFAVVVVVVVVVADMKI